MPAIPSNNSDAPPGHGVKASNKEQDNATANLALALLSTLQFDPESASSPEF
jgi:hypothetical protein